MLCKTVILYIGVGLFLPLFLHGQKLEEDKKSGEYKMRIEKNMTQEDAERISIKMAQINAIEKAFGKVIMQGNSTYIQNKNTNEKVETQSTFNFIADTYVNGEWVKDLGKPKTETKKETDGSLWIEANVYGIVRELKTSEVTFKANAASCPEEKCITELFNVGQDLYLIFKAPKDGYLAVYLDAPSIDTTYRILPYKQQASESCVKVKADEEYVFFSKKYDKSGNSLIVDELELSLTEKHTLEIDKLFVLYSPVQPLDKPMLNNIT